jgi:uncharacterized integral membrane protein
MHKILITLAGMAVLLVFGMQNSDHVVVSFVVGGPVRVRLIFLLLIAAASGFLAAYIHGLGREIKLKRQIHSLAVVHSRTPANTVGLALEEANDE